MLWKKLHWNHFEMHISRCTQFLEKANEIGGVLMEHLQGEHEEKG